MDAARNQQILFDRMTKNLLHVKTLPSTLPDQSFLFALRHPSSEFLLASQCVLQDRWSNRASDGPAPSSFWREVEKKDSISLLRGLVCR
jgi:hypothetical protein